MGVIFEFIFMRASTLGIATHIHIVTEGGNWLKHAVMMWSHFLHWLTLLGLNCHVVCGVIHLRGHERRRFADTEYRVLFEYRYQKYRVLSFCQKVWNNTRYFWLGIEYFLARWLVEWCRPKLDFSISGSLGLRSVVLAKSARWRCWSLTWTRSIG